MADHFGNEILFLVVTITFIVLLLANVTTSFSETRLDVVELNTDKSELLTYDTSWQNTGNNFWALQSLIPIEFFLLFILPFIVLIAYIGLKTVSGLAPNWISGG